jgi:hypothetical protein
VDPDEEIINHIKTRLSLHLPYLTTVNANHSTTGEPPRIDGSLPTPPIFSDVPTRPAVNIENMTKPLVDDPATDYALQLDLDEDTIRLLQTSSRYCQTRITFNWLMQLVKQFVVKDVQ